MSAECKNGDLRVDRKNEKGSNEFLRVVPGMAQCEGLTRNGNGTQTDH